MAIVSRFTEQKINVLIGIYVIVPNFLLFGVSSKVRLRYH